MVYAIVEEIFLKEKLKPKKINWGQFKNKTVVFILCYIFRGIYMGFKNLFYKNKIIEYNKFSLLHRNFF